MNLPISRKVEKAIATYLPSVLTISGLSIYEGHERADEMKLPAMVVYAESSSQHPEMPRETGVRIVNLRMKFIVDSDDNERGILDQWKQQLESAMLCLAGLQAALNAPAEGPDRRKVTGIHFHDVEIGDDPSARSETDWEEDQLFALTVERLD